MLETHNGHDALRPAHGYEVRFPPAPTAKTDIERTIVGLGLHMSALAREVRWLRLELLFQTLALVVMLSLMLAALVRGIAS